jgi:hypothetical protein
VSHLESQLRLVVAIAAQEIFFQQTTIGQTSAGSVPASVIQPQLVATATPPSDFTTSSPDDSIPVSNSATASVQPAAVFDLSITNTRAPGPIIPFSFVHYTAVVTNAGPGDASAVTMTYVFPSQSPYGGMPVGTPPEGGAVRNLL